MPKKKNKIQIEKRIHSGQNDDAYLFSIFSFEFAKIISFFLNKKLP
jgi:hypothetical protein